MKTSSNHFLGLPATAMGRRAVWLAVAFVGMFVSNILINVYLVRPASEPRLMAFYWSFVIFMLVAGLAGGIFGLMALIKQREHSSLVWLAVVSGLFVLLLVLNELVQGIQYFAGLQ